MEEDDGLLKRSVQAGVAAIEVARRASRFKETMLEDLDDAKEEARRLAKRGRRAAEDFADDLTYQIKKKPIESIGIALGVGALLGLALGAVLRGSRRRSDG